MESLAAFVGTHPGAALLFGVTLAASLIGLFVSPAWIERGVFRPFWVLRQREYASALTSAFLHADLPHLVFNAFTFWAFAFTLEEVMGSAAFLSLYFFGIAVSDLGTYVRHRHDPGYRTLGASGAITAVLFAAMVYAPSSSIYILPIPIPIPAPVFAFCYLAYSYYASRQLVGGINHDAHLAGAVAGIAFVALTDPAALAQAWAQVGARL